MFLQNTWITFLLLYYLLYLNNNISYILYSLKLNMFPFVNELLEYNIKCNKKEEVKKNVVKNRTI